MPRPWRAGALPATDTSAAAGACGGPGRRGGTHDGGCERGADALQDAAARDGQGLDRETVETAGRELDGVPAADIQELQQIGPVQPGSPTALVRFLLGVNAGRVVEEDDAGPGGGFARPSRTFGQDG
ncbi:hypothetical protein [Streptomyces sp. NPDC088801]|uniref:hypothetical protein n=1 Tax=Streptomyces sp. NPDC088801 TaxID=3365903 RepID=UPI0038142E47